MSRSQDGIPRVQDIDGSVLEGGGQILRNATALSVITGNPVHISNIRAGRRKPGLAAQHLTGLLLLQNVCQGSIEGAKVGSMEVTLTPGEVRGGEYKADTGTAGSCTLVMQAALPALLFANPSPSPVCHVEVRGGTDADMAPPVDYMLHVLLPFLRRHMPLLDIQVDLIRRGFYPRGGGVISATVHPLLIDTPLPPITLVERGKVVRIVGRAFSAGRARASSAEEMLQAAEREVRRSRSLRAAASEGSEPETLWEAVKETQESAFGDGCGMILVAETDTGCMFGASARTERGVAPSTTGQQCAAELVEALDSGACVDQWLQDQLVIFMALGSGTSSLLSSEPTLHTRTAMVIAETMLPGCTFRVTHPYKAPGNLILPLYLIECQGIGWSRRVYID